MLASAADAVARVPTLLDSVLTSEDLDEFTQFRHQLERPFQPLGSPIGYPEEPAPITEASLRAWQSSPQFAEAETIFANYPAHSLCQDIERMLLHHLVRTLRPEHVVEVGTYFASSAEVLARALWENGSGLLHTIDPFGKIRCPSLIARWDERLRNHVRFYPWNSMEFFQHLSERGIRLDLAFIDGNHDLEYALFDLQSAARLMKPGGIVIMDDSNQSGPFYASKVFLEQNPGWRELGSALSHADSDDPFGQVPAFFEGSKFLLLQAPQQIVVGRLPMTTGQVPYSGGRLDAIKFSFAPGQVGEILGRVFLRAFPNGARPEQIESRFRLTVRGEASKSAAFEVGPRSRYDGAAHQTIEIVVLWRPAHGGEPLILTSEPEVVSDLKSSSNGR